jgi:hypothetical protein
MNDDEPGPSDAQASRCPICRKPTVTAFRPFCSKHCADVDLLRWMNGSYAIPATEDDDEDGADPETDPPPPPSRRH